MKKAIQFGAVVNGAAFLQSGAAFIKTGANTADWCGNTVKFKQADIVTIEAPDPVPPTPEEIQASKERSFLRRLENFSGQSDLDDFIVRFQQEAAYALASSSRVIESAARVQVSRQVKAMLAKHSTADVMTEVLQETLRRARYPEHSTSMMSNLVYEAVTAAYAELVA